MNNVTRLEYVRLLLCHSFDLSIVTESIEETLCGFTVEAMLRPCGSKQSLKRWTISVREFNNCHDLIGSMLFKIDSTCYDNIVCPPDGNGSWYGRSYLNNRHLCVFLVDKNYQIVN